jgi:hypothetical protein
MTLFARAIVSSSDFEQGMENTFRSSWAYHLWEAQFTWVSLEMGSFANKKLK